MRTALAALVTAAALVLAGCGDSTDTGSTDGSEAEPNDADITFATQMIPHHAQALELVALADGRPLDPEVKELADTIASGQEPEIEEMSQLLESWGEDVPDTDMSMKDMGDMGSTPGMEGMISEKAMRQLKYAPDAAFQDVWLSLMIAHHEGAIAMAEAEIGDGEDPDAVALAEEIKAAQTDEVATMKQLIGGGA